MNKKTAIVLGGTFPHISLINNLKKRGYFTVLVDYFENPIAKQFADEHIQLSTLDKEKTLSLAKEKNAKLVISIAIDQANVTACYVSEKLGLPLPYSYQTALKVTNKHLMKDVLRSNNIPTPNYITINDLNQIQTEHLTFPLIVKPADSNSSKGVMKALNSRELNLYAYDALNISRTGEAIIEEFIEGVEVGIDCFITNNKAKVLITKTRRKIKTVENKAQQIFGCFWPADFNDKISKQFEIIATQIAKSFNLNNTPLMIQAIVKGNTVYVLEFGARIGGGESFRIIELITGVDVVNASVNSFLGVYEKIEPAQKNGYYAENFLYPKSGSFGKIEYSNDLISEKHVEFIDSFKTSGMSTSNDLTSNNRVGVFIVKAVNKEKLIEKINYALSKIEVLDLQGLPILNREIYE